MIERIKKIKKIISRKIFKKKHKVLWKVCSNDPIDLSINREELYDRLCIYIHEEMKPLGVFYNHIDYLPSIDTEKKEIKIESIKGYIRDVELSIRFTPKSVKVTCSTEYNCNDILEGMRDCKDRTFDIKDNPTIDDIVYTVDKFIREFEASRI